MTAHSDPIRIERIHHIGRIQIIFRRLRDLPVREQNSAEVRLQAIRGVSKPRNARSRYSAGPSAYLCKAANMRLTAEGFLPAFPYTTLSPAAVSSGEVIGSKAKAAEGTVCAGCPAVLAVSVAVAGAEDSWNGDVSTASCVPWPSKV
jgi:hypothetical protein